MSKVSPQKTINLYNNDFPLEPAFRITDIKRSFTENDNYTSPSLEIHYINIDTQQNSYSSFTPLEFYKN